MDDVCSRSPITIRSHDLHACDIRRVVGEIALTTTIGTISLSLFFGFLRLCVFWPFFGLPFLSPL